MSLLNLPDDVLEKVLSFISYDEVSRCRLVCKRFDHVSKRVLNRGFRKVEKYHQLCLRRVKSQLPRRESERKKHPLARHCEILIAVETRLSLLGMTFMKSIEMDQCCFIPGKVLDEIFKVLRYVTVEQGSVRAHEVLQELRDLSSMAMEHFEEQISPAFKKQKETGPKVNTANVSIAMHPSVSFHNKSSSSRHGSSEHSRQRLKVELHNIARNQIIHKKEIHTMKRTLGDVCKTGADLEKKVLELQNALSTHLEKVKEQDLTIDVINRTVDSNKDFPPALTKKTPSLSTKDGKVLSDEANGSVNTETNKSSGPKRRTSERLQTERARKVMKLF